MRFILSLFLTMAFIAPSFAADNHSTQKPSLVKGTKSYQVRYTKPSDISSPESVEPAAGVDTEKSKPENASAVTSSQDDMAPKKVMKLHGKR